MVREPSDVVVYPGSLKSSRTRRGWHAKPHPELGRMHFCIKGNFPLFSPEKKKLADFLE